MSRSEPVGASPTAAAGGSTAGLTTGKDRLRTVKPGPTPAEMAAIVAAIEVAWPRAVVVAEDQPPARPWRWSGRWWTTGKPVAAARHRPAGL